MTDWTARLATIRERDYNEAARSVMAGDRTFLLNRLQAIEAEAVARERARLREAVAGLPYETPYNFPLIDRAAALALLADPK